MLYRTKLEAIIKELGLRGKIIKDEILNNASIVEVDKNESSQTVVDLETVENWSFDEVKNWIVDKNLKS